jgi:ATP/maltotriose-dependent transcriptional regulator MalT
MAPIADRLFAARRRYFTGRTAERTLFQAALTAAELPFQVLYVFGPGGVGKTTLLREFAAIAQQLGASVGYLDAQNCEPVPASFLSALQATLGLASNQDLIAALNEERRRKVIFLDTCELLAPLEGWLREVFFPSLPENILIVLAGRRRPSSDWQVDAGWQALVHVLPLRNLSPDESRAYLHQRGVPEAQFDAMLSFTHGHPLALSLVAETFAQRDAQHEMVIFQPEAAPNIIKTLVEQFLQKTPDSSHRAALEACAQVRLLDEPLLAAMLSLPEPHELFDWLRGLSFIESGPQRLFPHDLAREALAADLRWRHPDWYRELHRRARAFYTNRLSASQRGEQQRLLFDLVFLHRDNPAVRPFFEWAESGAVLPDALREADRPTLLAMAAQHEGTESAHQAVAAQERPARPQTSAATGGSAPPGRRRGG